MIAHSRKKKRIKVIRLVPVLDFGGVESRIVLTSELIDRQRFDYRICTFWKPGAAARRIEEQGIPVDVLGLEPAIRHTQATTTLVRYLRKHKPDILHASIGEGIFHASLAGSIANVPVRINEEVGIPSRGALGRFVFGALSHLATTTVGVAQVVCDYLQNQEHMTRVRLIHNCGKPEYFGEVTRHWDIPDDRPFRILNVGRLVWEKNQERLIEAFAKLLNRGCHAELWIAGEGEKRRVLEAKIASLNLGQSVRLLGFRNDIHALLNKVDLFVLPSVSEGCSVTLVESMATATPSLASTFPGNLELLGPLSKEASIDPLDTDAWAAGMHKIASMQPHERQDLGQRASAIARSGFAPDHYMSRVEAMYVDLVAQARATHGGIA